MPGQLILQKWAQWLVLSRCWDIIRRADRRFRFRVVGARISVGPSLGLQLTLVQQREAFKALNGDCTIDLPKAPRRL